jgi:hypothetical protein
MLKSARGDVLIYVKWEQGREVIAHRQRPRGAKALAAPVLIFSVFRSHLCQQGFEQTQ